jgi:large subunit ribosomal protein LP2
VPHNFQAVRRFGLALLFMRYIAAYLLAVTGGDANPSKAKITAILTAAGVSVDAAAIDTLLGKVAGKNIADVIADGTSKLSIVGGGASSSAPAAAANSAPVAEAPKKEEEAVVELAGGFDDLFG